MDGNGVGAATPTVPLRSLPSHPVFGIYRFMSHIVGIQGASIGSCTALPQISAQESQQKWAAAVKSKGREWVHYNNVMSRAGRSGQRFPDSGQRG